MYQAERQGADQRARRVAEVLRAGGALRADVAGGVHDRDDVGGVADQRAVALVAAAQRLAHELALDQLAVKLLVGELERLRALRDALLKRGVERADFRLRGLALGGAAGEAGAHL